MILFPFCSPGTAQGEIGEGCSKGSATFVGSVTAPAAVAGIKLEAIRSPTGARKAARMDVAFDG